MAKAIPTTPYEATEVLPYRGDVPESVISEMFPHLLDALMRHIQVERDLEDVDFWNIAFLNWRIEAEEAYTDVAALLSAIRHAALDRQEDLPLQRMACLIDSMIGSEEPDAFQRLHCRLPRFETLFRSRGYGTGSKRVERMLMDTHACIDELATLRLYGGADFDMDSLAFEPGDQLAA
ncbi:hypothetical protein JHX88_15360 [Paracoccus saliphilus]|nr:hypothetical protein [Paracoccus saliphilus]WCR02256.1 hypothetical protein JHX88_15360 [Paracoccus saliphilus]